MRPGRRAPAGGARAAVGGALRRLVTPRWCLPPAAPLDVEPDVLARAGGYPAYRQLHRLLVENRAGPGIEALYAALGGDDDSLRRVERLVAGLAADRTGSVMALFEEAMRLPASHEVLAGYLERMVPRRLDDAEHARRGRGHVYAWAIGYLLDAALTGFEVTGSRRLLALAGEALDRMLERRDDVTGLVDGIRGRAMRSWGGTGLVRGKHTVNVTLAGRVAWLFARWAVLAGGSGDAGPGDSGRADRFAAAAAECLADFSSEYRIELDGTGWFPGPDGRAEPINHLAALGTALLEVADATGADWAHAQAEGIARFVAAAISPDRAGLPVWSYSVDPVSRHGRGAEFVWKAQITAQFVGFAANRNVVFGRDDLAAICRTLVGNVFTERGVNATIYRRFVPLEAYRGVRGGFQSLLPLRRLGDRCPAVAGAVDDMVALRPEAGGWLARPQGAVGYATRLTGCERCRARSGSDPPARPGTL